MSRPDHDEFDDGECWQCGGEGRVNDCLDGCCVEQDDIYCPYCSKRCDVCNPPAKGNWNKVQEPPDDDRAISPDAATPSQRRPE